MLGQKKEKYGVPRYYTYDTNTNTYDLDEDVISDFRGQLRGKDTLSIGLRTRTVFKSLTLRL